MPKLTARQISNISGVSPASVSRVLSNSANVSPEIRDKVINTAKALGYPLTKKKAKSEHKLIGLLVPKLSNPFYVSIIDGIQDVAANEGYNLIISQVKPGETNGENVNVPTFLNDESMVHGIISLCKLTSRSKILEAISPEMPVVQCCEYDEELPYPSVSIDDYSAAYSAVAYLINTGRKKIALVNSTSRTQYGLKRERGYRDAMIDHGLFINEDWVLHLGEVDFNVALAASQDIFSAVDHPDAVFAVSDVYAAGVMRAVKKCGWKIPTDVAIVGFDDTEIALMNDPPLTTVRQPRYKIGCTACSTLMRMIRTGEAPSQRVLIESDLIVRNST